jgi:anthranilate/para-aminobenzoate synthase component I
VPAGPARQQEVDSEASLWEIAAALRRGGSSVHVFSGEGWTQGPLLAVQAEVELVLPSGVTRNRTREALASLGRRVARRSARGGPAETGIIALLSYDLWQSPVAGMPALIAWSVSRSVRSLDAKRVLVSAPRGERVERLLAAPSRSPEPGVAEAARAAGRPRTSLPRQAYLRTVARVRRLIEEGEIYQANLCQRFSVAYLGDPFELQRSLVRDNPAPHSAYLETSAFALASSSPETFLRVRTPGQVETWPIKGTRPRYPDAAADEAAARALECSAKDRAELVMIVDLERNDLSRVCEAGTVEVRQLAALRTFPTVHHLEAEVVGRLREGVGVDGLIEATFPGGSITGAPKIRAMEILRRLEPERRGYFTGSLFWFGDDGSMDSSILIRTLVFDGKRASLGAGGGVVADSEPEGEWCESNHKARFLAGALGFEPEEAS